MERASLSHLDFGRTRSPPSAVDRRRTTQTSPNDASHRCHVSVHGYHGSLPRLSSNQTTSFAEATITIKVNGSRSIASSRRGPLPPSECTIRICASCCSCRCEPLWTYLSLILKTRKRAVDSSVLRYPVKRTKNMDFWIFGASLGIKVCSIFFKPSRHQI